MKFFSKQKFSTRLKQIFTVAFMTLLMSFIKSPKNKSNNTSIVDSFSLFAFLFVISGAIIVAHERAKAEEKKSRFPQMKLKELLDDLKNADPKSKEPWPQTALCPISLQPMFHPVQTPYGHFYEKSMILKWLKTHDVDPLNRLPLCKDDLIDYKHLLGPKMRYFKKQIEINDYRLFKSAYLSDIKSTKAPGILGNLHVFCRKKSSNIYELLSRKDASPKDMSTIKDYASKHSKSRSASIIKKLELRR